MIGNLFRRLFNLYPGEEKKAFLFACLGFLWALSVTCGQKFADALFLIHIGSESLPTAYACSSIGNILIASFMLYGFHVATPSRLFQIVLSAGICFYLFAYMSLSYGLGHETQWLWFALKVFGWLFFTVVVTCFWTYIDQYYHLQDAKRLYSLFSSSVFIGLASTGLIMRLGVLDAKNLVLVVVCLLAVTFFWVRLISRKLSTVPDDTASEGGNIMEAHQTFRSVVKGILSSRLTLLLMTGNLLIQVLSVITEFNYLSDFDKYFDRSHTLNSAGEENASLTLFLGQLVAGVSITNLIVGVFIYGHVVRRFGISNLVACTPTVLFLIFSGWLFSDALLFPILGFFVVEGMLYVVDDCNFTLLLNAVPSKLKYKVRIAIESFFEPIGMLFSAMLISFVHIDSKILGLGLSVVAIVVALALRSQYFKGIYANLADNAIHFQRSLQDWWRLLPKRDRKAAEYRMLAVLKQGDESAQILACEGLIAFEDATILHKLLQFADYLTISGKIKFIELIGQSSFQSDNRVLDHLHHWLFDLQDPQLKSAVHFYLAKQGLLHPEKVSADLESDDLSLRGAAILALKNSWANQSPVTVAANRAIAAQHLQQLLDSSLEAEICMGLTIMATEPSPNDMDIVMSFLRHPSILVARAAAAAASQLIDQEETHYTQMLISHLGASTDSEFRISCLKTLGIIGDSSCVKDIIIASVPFRPNERRCVEAIIFKMGLRTVPTLLSITKDVTLHDRSRVLAGRILGRLSLPQLRVNLHEIIHGEIERAYFYFYHHHTIQTQESDLERRILQDALLTNFHSVLDFIIQLLGIAGSVEDCELLSRSLRSKNPKIRSQVVEALERTCDPKIFRMLQPLVSDLPLEEKMKAYNKGNRTPLSLNELLDRLDQSPSLADQIMSATLQFRLNLPNWRESIRQQMPLNKELFHHFAYELLETS